MIDFSKARLTKFASTWVGCKGRYEGVSIPKQTVVALSDVAEEYLTVSFLKPFEKTAEHYYFDSSLAGEESEDYIPNKVFEQCHFIFDSLKLTDASTVLTDLLYNVSENPKIQGGEFFLAFFEDLVVDGNPTSAIGMWKVQDKDYFYRTERSADQFIVSTMEGIKTGKPQVAALIFNIGEGEGYQVCAIDTVSKKTERSFWKDDFLRIRPMEDSYFQTRHTMNLVSEFITGKAPIKFGLNRIDVMSLLVKAGDHFKDNDILAIQDLGQRLFGDATNTDELIESLFEYHAEYCAAYAIPLMQQFDINQAAVKKEIKLFRVSLKLDKNFVMSVKGRTDMMEEGYDEKTGRKYYKFYYESQE